MLVKNIEKLKMLFRIQSCQHMIEGFEKNKSLEEDALVGHGKS
jgi:hypothetical protein